MCVAVADRLADEVRVALAAAVLVAVADRLVAASIAAVASWRTRWLAVALKDPAPESVAVAVCVTEEAAFGMANIASAPCCVSSTVP